MIATLRRRLIVIPGRLIRHARRLVLRLPPSHYLLPEILTRLRHPLLMRSALLRSARAELSRRHPR
jgi:hypothetical protein